VNTSITWQQTLSTAEIDDVDAMLNRVSDADGVSSLSEHTYLHVLAGGGPGQQHALAIADGRIGGYGHISHDPAPVAELLVDPALRGRGIGGQMLAEVLQRGGPDLRIWAHGQLPAAQILAERAGMVPVRRLCRYTRLLSDLPDRPVPGQFEVRPFTVGDVDAWLALNAAAFVDLPDQGSWTRADLEQRLRQPWFDPAGFLLAFDDQGLAGFHWTKVHGGAGHDHQSMGEVYVLAVARRTQGTGLGSALTVAGLDYLRSQGLRSVMLYVDSSNVAAVGMYTHLGFTCADCDVQYAVASGATDCVLSGTVEP
jgi:mycothiol synthase